MPTLPEGSNCGRTSSMTWQQWQQALRSIDQALTIGSMGSPCGICRIPMSSRPKPRRSHDELSCPEENWKFSAHWDGLISFCLKGFLWCDRCSMEVPIGSYWCALHSLHCVCTTRSLTCVARLVPTQGVALDIIGVFKHVLHNVAHNSSKYLKIKCSNRRSLLGYRATVISELAAIFAAVPADLLLPSRLAVCVSVRMPCKKKNSRQWYNATTLSPMPKAFCPRGSLASVLPAPDDRKIQEVYGSILDLETREILGFVLTCWPQPPSLWVFYRFSVRLAPVTASIGGIGMYRVLVFLLGVLIIQVILKPCWNHVETMVETMLKQLWESERFRFQE